MMNWYHVSQSLAVSSLLLFSWQSSALGQPPKTNDLNIDRDDLSIERTEVKVDGLNANIDASREF